MAVGDLLRLMARIPPRLRVFGVGNGDRQSFDRRELGRHRSGMVAAYGSPEDNPTFWRNASPVTFFDRVTEPILVHQGTADESCSH